MADVIEVTKLLDEKRYEDLATELPKEQAELKELVRTISGGVWIAQHREQSVVMLAEMQRVLGWRHRTVRNYREALMKDESFTTETKVKVLKRICNNASHEKPALKRAALAILDLGLDANYRTQVKEKTLAHLAVKYGQEELCDALVKKSRHWFLRLFDRLFFRSPPILLRVTKTGKNALHYAGKGGHERLLLSLQKWTGLKLGGGIESPMWSLYEGGHHTVYDRLKVKNPCTIDFTQTQDLTPLISKYLDCKNGATVIIRMVKDGLSPLTEVNGSPLIYHLAVREKQLSEAKELLGLVPATPQVLEQREFLAVLRRLEKQGPCAEVQKWTRNLSDQYRESEWIYTLASKGLTTDKKRSWSGLKAAMDCAEGTDAVLANVFKFVTINETIGTDQESQKAVLNRMFTYAISQSDVGILEQLFAIDPKLSSEQIALVEKTQNQALLQVLLGRNVFRDEHHLFWAVFCNEYNIPPFAKETYLSAYARAETEQNENVMQGVLQQIRQQPFVQKQEILKEVIPKLIQQGRIEQLKLFWWDAVYTKQHVFQAIKENREDIFLFFRSVSSVKMPTRVHVGGGKWIPMREWVNAHRPHFAKYFPAPSGSSGAGYKSSSNHSFNGHRSLSGYCILANAKVFVNCVRDILPHLEEVDKNEVTTKEKEFWSVWDKNTSTEQDVKNAARNLWKKAVTKLRTKSASSEKEEHEKVLQAVYDRLIDRNEGRHWQESDIPHGQK